MNSQNEFLMITMYVLGQLPMLVLWIVGIILAIKNWTAYPKVATLAMIGFITLILQTLVFSVVSVVLPQLLIRNDSNSEVGLYFSIFGVVKSLFSAASWGLIVAAVFTQRYKK
ncbi:MAG: hypothetical protein HY819_18260 [Acidobacteria bacterium]|nr:hypothetical protein [Acidobacteriota bacterium]